MDRLGVVITRLFLVLRWTRLFLDFRLTSFSRGLRLWFRLTFKFIAAARFWFVLVSRIFVAIRSSWNGGRSCRCWMLLGIIKSIGCLRNLIYAYVLLLCLVVYTTASFSLAFRRPHKWVTWRHEGNNHGLGGEDRLYYEHYYIDGLIVDKRFFARSRAVAVNA